MRWLVVLGVAVMACGEADSWHSPGERGDMRVLDVPAGYCASVYLDQGTRPSIAEPGELTDCVTAPPHAWSDVAAEVDSARLYEAQIIYAPLIDGSCPLHCVR